MDVVTDLASEAITYITLMQDVYRHSEHKSSKKLQGKEFNIWGRTVTWDSLRETVFERIKEIVFVSRDAKPYTVNQEALCNYFLEVAQTMTLWLEENEICRVEDKRKSTLCVEASPACWRQKIRERLYEEPQSRFTLSKCLNYIPLLVVYGLNGKLIKDLYKQRLLQVFSADKAFKFLLSKNDVSVYTAWKYKSVKDNHDEQNTVTRKLLIEQLVVHDELLLDRLKKNNIPLPFETLFHEELNEIERSRNLRSFPTRKNNKKDPFTRASKMETYGLAFSGGGIRSATFNLGILQKLASLGVLKKFDYLSTVSGGGYIGSWYASWIQRSGDINKVEERLNPEISNDPLAEEVRPIRWLRMYSNYLTPISGIMSVDSWTAGITWLRNTLINQLILLLLFVTALSCIDLVYVGWLHIFNRAGTYVYSIIIAVIFGLYISIISLTAGFGIRIHEASVRERKWLIEASKNIPKIMIIVSFIMAFISAAWFSKKNFHEYIKCQRITLFIWVMVAVLLGVTLIAILGNYFKKPLSQNIKLTTAIIISSILAAVSGGLLFVMSCFLISKIKNFNTVIITNNILIDDTAEPLQFIFGLPIFIEAMSLTVIIRMLLMGNRFPDSRREWWGRMGGLTHRIMFIWILGTFGAIFLPMIFQSPGFKEMSGAPFVSGGWTAVVLTAVKMAFDSGGESDSKKKGYNVKEIFVRFAPYLFMIGFLLIACSILTFIHEALPDNYINGLLPEDSKLGKTELPWLHSAVKTLGLILITFLLSWRAGVNEFSLHHFYRNRLVRAYLGATRRRISRDISANRFTGFDSKDDIKLADFRTDKNYDGPYPIINTALNATSVTDLDRQDRKAESFIFSPLYCGFDFSPTRSAGYSHSPAYEYAYRETERYSVEGGPSLGTAISGAAANPNMGYHSSSATAFMLTMFNVRLGWWIGNPRLDAWKRSEPRTGLIYLIKDLIGRSSVNTDYVCLSDGGHFDNMGIYELVRRRCSYILLCDAEQDENGICEGLANAVRRCRIDFGVEINLDVSGILNLDKETGYAAQHLKQGTIIYPDGKKGKIIYVKTSLKNPESADLREYSKRNPLFPQQSTADQFYDEAQFESYRKLGFESIQTLAEIGM